jgi:hypothetical protein
VLTLRDGDADEALLLLLVLLLLTRRHRGD